MSKTVTLDEFISAIEEGGLPQTFRSFYEYDNNGNINSACALGMAALNLEVGTFAIKYALDPIKVGLSYDISNMNDYHRMSFKRIANDLRITYKNYLDTELTFEWVL